MHCSREFVNTEEPKNWNHSYEVSDHLSAEDSSGSGSGSAADTHEDKENNSVPASSVCERAHIDITLNLQTSVDVTLLPCELSTKKQKEKDQVRDSLFLTLEERQGLQDTLYERRIMDKTLDVMSGSLVARLQSSVGKRESSIHTTANCMSDSFMDITPLSHTLAAPAPAPAAPASQHPVDIELEMFNDHQNLLANEKENICPAQKSLFMELEMEMEEEEEAVKPIKNKTQHEAVDISFASSLNVFADRDLLPPSNISFESVSSANSTINFKDDSVLVPLDMISGKRISKKINLRQLNDELESGKIQLFPNGPKTPTTDRTAKMKRYWRALGVEEMDNEEECPAQDIKSSIKPRGMLNFSESMVMSPAPAAPTQKDIRNKAKDKDEKRKYRFSQADEIMLDNTNFLAHARLGDETQSRNTSKNSTRRETTYDYSELDLERPASRQDSHHPMPSFRPRQSIHHPEAMEEDQSVSFSAVKNTAAPPPRRTVHQPVEMEADQSVSFSAIPAAKTTAPAPPPQDQEERAKEATVPAYTRIKTKRRETLLLQVSMEEEIITPPVELHSAPVEKTNSNPRHTLHLAEDVEKENVVNSSQELPLSKSRQSVLLDEPMEEEIEFGIKDPPDARQMVTESKQALDMEEEEIHPDSKEPLTVCPTHKSRRTIVMSEAIAEDKSIIQPSEPSLLKYKTFEAPHRPKTRHTLLMAEPMEEDRVATFKSSIPIREQSRSKPRNTILMAEPMLEDSVCNVVEKEINFSMKHPPEEIQADTKARQTLDMEEEEIQPNPKEPVTLYPSHKSRRTIIMSEAIEEDTSIIQPSDPSLLKYKTLKEPNRLKTRHTLLMAEPIEEDQLNAVKSSIPTRKPRNTILMAEPMLEDSICSSAERQPMQQTLERPEKTSSKPEEIEQEMDLESPASNKFLKQHPASLNPRKTIIKAEPIEEDEIVPRSGEQSLSKLTPYLEEPIEKGAPSFNQSSKSRRTIIKSEPIEEEPSLSKSSVSYRRQTLVKAEPIEEDEHLPSQEEHPRPKSRDTILVTEEILEDLDLKSINKPVSVDYQSPQETMPKPDLEVITPMPHPRLTSIYRDLGNFTPGMSLTEFEDQEEMCKTPLPKPKPKQKQRSVYHPTKMDTSAFGTPVNPSNHKRLPKHLTPNLPESKKRHTQLFADSQMEIEVDMEDEAGEGANTALEEEPQTHKFLRGFKIDPFDETVQPVRDYHPAVSSLDDVLQVPRPSELEEKPITISDVTNYFQKEKQEEEERRESGSSSSDRTFKSYAVAHTKFINLSGDTTIFAGAIDVDEPEEQEQDDMENESQIGNEQISLVSTLAEETVENEQEPEEPEPELCQAQKAPLVVVAGSTDSCRKCGNCNRSLNESRRSSDFFVLPQISLFEFTKDHQRLCRQRQKISFEEMQKHWQVKSQETEMNESLDETKVEERLFHWDKAKLMLTIKRPKLRRNRDVAPAKSKESFFDRLDRLLADQQPNWIFDFQLKASRQLIFCHRLLTTFRIVVNYKVLDEQDESAIRVCSVAEEQAVAGCPPERWTTFEHYLHFQLSLKMPPNLSDALGGSDEESFLKFLQRIDHMIVGIKRTFHKLMTVLKATNARLLRKSNRIIVRKILVKCIEDEPLVRFERTNFVVQIANVEEICFTDVLQPELYLFNENLQFLPKGIAFLEAFLPNPEQYLKTST
ncbi:hypothetical protein KR054_002328 [Drosophila jambulina]|nr:hypothetical protein KR054_002328 [Drosophila jambulina]